MGITAKSLTLVEGIRSIDVVDISRDILEMSEIVFPEGILLEAADPSRGRLRVESEIG